MGRKGTSKGKSKKTKTGPVVIGGGSDGSFGSKINGAMPAKVTDRGASVPQNRGGIKPSSKH
jgi:hypothetical protein